MGQKVNPIGFRIGVYLPWDSRWFAKNESYAQMFFEDLKIREFIHQQLSGAEISHIEIEKAGENIRVIIHSARVGVVIGKRGQDIDTLRKKLSQYLNSHNMLHKKPGQSLAKKNVEISVQEVRQPELDANLVAKSIAEQIERRTSYKRAMKKEASNAMRAGALGINIAVSGRLGDADIARREMVRVGVVPRHTLRANIGYGTALAKTTFGIIGVKVWIYLGPFNIG